MKDAGHQEELAGRGGGKSLGNKALQTARPAKFLRVRNKNFFPGGFFAGFLLSQEVNLWPESGPLVEVERRISL